MCVCVRKGHVSIEECVDTSVKGLEDYINNSKERLIIAARYSIGYIKTNRKNRKQKWEEKQRNEYSNRRLSRKHGHGYERETSEAKIGKNSTASVN